LSVDYRGVLRSTFIFSPDNMDNMATELLIAGGL
jgi:hypothetical protein